VKTVVGFGAEYSSLGGMLEGVAAAMDLTIVPDPVPEERAFYRSDHYALVQKGVPALMLLGAPAGATETWVQRASTWLETDYHQAGDVVRPDWDWGGAQTIAEVGLVVGLRVANAEATPQWLPTSPFKRPAAR
jgi:Zn-dependent M28 family amino/carboxypeptidase